MAGLNEKVVLAAVGELECVDGKPIEIPEEERIGEAVLISTQLARAWPESWRSATRRADRIRKKCWRSPAFAGFALVALRVILRALAFRSKRTSNGRQDRPALSRMTQGGHSARPSASVARAQVRPP